MLGIYRGLLRFYPAAHRKQFGAEMAVVFRDLEADAATCGRFAQAIFRLHEITGLLTGAVREHVRAFGGDRDWLPLPIRSFTMHSEFRFPKSTPVLMTMILAGIIVAIEKGKAIQASLPDLNPPIGPIQPPHHAFLPSIVLALVIFYAAGLIGWGILYALRRSGVHRLDETPAIGK